MLLPRRRVIAPASVMKPGLGAELDFGHPLAQGLVGCWLMNEGSGNKVNDLSGYANHGTLVNGPTWVAGDRGGLAANFPAAATTSYIDGGASEGLEIVAGQSMTIIASVYPRVVSTGSHHIVNRIDPAANDRRNYALRIEATGILGFHYRNVTNTAWNIWKTGAVCVANAWQQLAVSYTMGTGATLRTYRNGQNVAGSWTTGTGNEAPYTTGAQNIAIGLIVHTAIEPFNGLVDTVAIYNRALSATEIAELYSQPFAYYPRPRRFWYTTEAGTQTLTSDIDDFILNLSNDDQTIDFNDRDQLLHISNDDQIIDLRTSVG